ncbi:hypothetical protein AMTR_s00076p00180150 [Amborella trichopoda]|uniref:BURP domain-containing protein n=1 Tax=Amborella trichopoda TaxID=13333 RepID=W1P9W6_AMBTC|nr:hypothetical protein AMTR_s00076p00180150 [Amborella trichopoda]
MHEFVLSIFGLEANLQVLATTMHNKGEMNPLVQAYIVQDIPVQMTLPSLVVCHTISYPYAVFYCHNVIKAKAFKAKLEGEDGNKVDAVAICHLDTSSWDPNHVSFKVLGSKPGVEPVFHFLPEDNLVWLTKSLEADM